MGGKTIVIRERAADSISDAAFFIESKGLPQTAEKFANDVYDFIETLGVANRTFRVCRDRERALLGYKCVRYKKYTAVFIEDEDKLTVTEFLPSKLIYW